MRIAVCQMRVVDSDVEGNFHRMDLAAEQARRHHADIACFPEAALLGWGNPNAPELAHPIPGAHSRRLSEMAVRFGLMICAGLNELDAGCLYNTALLIERDGAVLHRHRKINLIPDVEAPPTIPGEVDGLSAVETRLGRIGLMICADSFIREHRERLAAHKPDVVLIPYAWAAPAEAWPRHGEKLRAVIEENAREIGCPVVGTDGVGVLTGGPWQGQLVGGCSAVYWPEPGLHMNFPCQMEGVWVVEL